MDAHRGTVPAIEGDGVSDIRSLVYINAHIAKLRIIAEIHAHWDDIVALSVERAEGVGVTEYGDASFHKSSAELRRERFEEYADALFYFQVEHRERE